MEEPEFTTVETMDLTAGEPCLDFVNTGSRLRERHAGLEGAELEAAGPFGDRLRGYGDLVTLGERTGLVDGALGARLRAAASADAEGAAAVLERARALREALFRVFTGPAGPDAADLVLVQREAAAAAARQQLVTGAGGFVLEWPEAAELERVLWPLATSALALLLSADAARVKECAGHDCNWIFLDLSRNRSRRWCDMKACGNREKARQFYRRQHGG